MIQSIEPMDPAVSIALIAGWISLSYLLFQKIQLKDPETKKAKEIVKNAQKKMKELQKRGKMDEKLLDEVLKAQSTLMTKMMMPTMILGIFALFIFQQIGEVYGGFIMVLPMTIPWPALAIPPLVFTNTIGWLGWYVVCSLGWSLSLRRLLKVDF
jgi:uncharacterized membrane protein (DUF106 family)